MGRRRALSGLLGSTLMVLGGATACRSTTEAEPPTDGGATPAQPPGLPATLDPELHLLRRLTYGPTAAGLARIREIGPEAWLDDQLNPALLDTAGIDDELVGTFPELDQPAAEILANFQADGNGQRLATILPASLLVRHTTSPAQLHERMVEFWGDHFNVPQISPPLMAARVVMDREVFRRHALGRFDELLVATAQSPAMLIYLDNARSRAGAINENYSRELLELHTVGLDGGFSENDIVNVAGLLTGWTLTRDVEFQFAPRRHDSSSVSVLGWDRPSSGDPLDDGVQFFHHLARLPQTARHVCHKLAVRFVTDEPDDELVAAMTEAWLTNDTAIAPVLRAMISHTGFAAAAPKFNRPWDFLIQTLRSVDAVVDVGSPGKRRALANLIQGLGQPPFRHASPDGYPDSESAWLNAGGLLARWNLVMKLTLSNDRLVATNLGQILDVVENMTAAEVFDRYAGSLRHEPSTAEQVELLSELTNWTTTDAPSAEEVQEAAPYIAFAMLAHPKALYR